MASEFQELMKAERLEDIEVLLSQGFKPTELDNEEYDALYSAFLLPANHSLHQKENIENTLKLVFQYDPNLLHRLDKHGLSLAHFLAREGYDAVLTALIEQNRGRELMKEEVKQGCLPIHNAIINRKADTVKLLLTIPGMIAVKDFKNRNIFHYAASYGTEAVMRHCCLIANVSELVNAKDDNDQTPAQLLFEDNITDDVEEMMALLETLGGLRPLRLPSPFDASPT
jgi:hypothetical protein